MSVRSASLTVKGMLRTSSGEMKMQPSQASAYMIFGIHTHH